LKKILIIRFSSIGDIVLTTPVVRCLKKQVAAIEIHYLTKKAFEPVLLENPYVDRIFTIQESIREVLNLLRQENYDYIVDLHKNFRSLGIRLCLLKKSGSFPKLNYKKWLLVRFKMNRMPDIHIVDRYFDAVRHLPVKNDQKGLDYFIPAGDQLKMTDLPETHQNGFIGLVIGGKHKTKQVPVVKLTELCHKLSYPITVLGGPEDVEDANALKDNLGNRIYVACGKYNLNQSASLVRLSSVVITNDTGLMHVAAAFHKKIVSVWGNTMPELGMYPYLPEEPGNYKMFEVKGLSCRPCSKIGFDICPEKHFDCMMKQDIDNMVDAVRRYLIQNPIQF